MCVATVLAIFPPLLLLFIPSRESFVWGGFGDGYGDYPKGGGGYMEPRPMPMTTAAMGPMGPPPMAAYGRGYDVGSLPPPRSPYAGYGAGMNGMGMGTMNYSARF